MKVLIARVQLRGRVLVGALSLGLSRNASSSGQKED